MDLNIGVMPGTAAMTVNHTESDVRGQTFNDAVVTERRDPTHRNDITLAL